MGPWVYPWGSMDGHRLSFGIGSRPGLVELRHIDFPIRFHKFGKVGIVLLVLGVFAVQVLNSADPVWLDMTMALTDYFDMEKRIELKHYRIDRLMYGSDFPNIPYAWDRELKCLQGSGLSDYDLERILDKNAIEFFNITDHP